MVVLRPLSKKRAEMSPSPSVQLSSLHPVIARPRCSSYTSIVHQEKESDFLTPPAILSLQRLIQTTVEWLVILQRLEEERKTDLPAVLCRCSKAVNMNSELKRTMVCLTDLCRSEERLGQVGLSQLDGASQLVGQVANLLRADVSILIPSSLGRAEPNVSLQARIIVSEADCPRLLVEETLDCVTRLVYKLLSVETCSVCHPTSDQMDIDPDIMNMVATMCGDNSNMVDTDRENRSHTNHQIGKEVLEKSRKRKQNRPQKFQMPLLPQTSSRNLFTSYNQESLSPTKKVRKLVEDREEGEEKSAKEVLFLLEKKKKLPKADGLYKFVLWREALKTEKNKFVLSS